MDWFKVIIAAMWTVAIIFLMWSHNEPLSEVFACKDLPTNVPADVRKLCKFK
jgi:hypothetical protein